MTGRQEPERPAPLGRKSVVGCLAISVGGGVGAVVCFRMAAGLFGEIDWFRTSCFWAAGLAISAGTIWGFVRHRAQLRLQPGGYAVAFGVVVLLGAFAFPGPVHSSIWAGYDTGRRSATSVTATWTQPTVRSRAIGWAEASFWVGLQGIRTRTVEQIGVFGVVEDGGVADYHAWYETYPRPLVPISQTKLLVSAGDVVTATVAVVGQDRFRFSIADRTTGARFATTRTVMAVGDTAAAVSVEAPEERSIALASFDSVQFTACAVDGRAIATFALTKKDIVTRNGVVKAVTGSVGADHTSFSVLDR